MKIIPAYGRSYKTPDAAIEDWKAGKDFRIVNGPYLSIRDVKAMMEDRNPIDEIMFGSEVIAELFWAYPRRTDTAIYLTPTDRVIIR